MKFCAAFCLPQYGYLLELEAINLRDTSQEVEMMHSVLLIDEILQVILEHVLDDGKSTLCCAATCCQAWKDPALDRIWRCLPSAVPLFSLLPGFSIENDGLRFDTAGSDMASAVFRSYAIRVKYITHRHRVLVDPTSVLTPSIHQMINLETARIESRAVEEVVLRLSLAPRLRCLALQVGYTKSNSSQITVHDMVSLLKGYSSLEQLSIRGHSSECLHIPLSSTATLRSLSLHLSSFTEQALMTISTFPGLVDFDIHADHLSPNSLSAAIARACGAPFFPALETLKIRARPELVALILQQLSRLRSLRVDATSPGSISTFDGLFAAMTSLPLHEFILEHSIPIDDLEVPPAYPLDALFTLDHLRPLLKLPLRSIILDTSLPPDLSDPDIKEMTKWWPHLERLQLGASDALENVGTSWKPRISLAGLSALARGCSHLERLVITLDMDTFSFPDPGTVSFGSHPLASLSISSRSRPNINALSAILYRLFPSLLDVTPGFVGEYEDAWDAVQATLSNLSREC